MDGGVDAMAGDAGRMELDTGRPPMPDAGPDGGPPIIRMTCEACETHAECGAGAFCVNLTVGGRACLPGCNPDLPDCPRSFSCVLDIASGVDSPVCALVGGVCCVDEDDDDHGVGVGCMGPDCDDGAPTIHPGAPEICNGIDEDCDGSPDDPPTDCASGRCTPVGDGTYEAIEGANCVMAECVAGTETMCGLYTCDGGGAAGTRCAAQCAPAGTDDDTFCIATAHCDADACVPDEPNGGMCDEDSDCTSSHCDNGFCCGTGTCCGTTADCPGGGAVARICETPATCQGSRGETTCDPGFQCRAVAGIPDDTACDTGVRALDCGLYDPVFCTGAESQPPPSCPGRCTMDSECVDTAHCDFGACVPNRPPGATCGRVGDCLAGLFCVDGVCCGSPCTGTCEACNLPFSLGTCAPVPLMGDPAAECGGFSCGTYYSGFTGGEDVCYRRQDVNDTTAACNGAGACLSPATLCPLQPRGMTQIDCNNTCQSPIVDTCTAMTPGACRDLDATAGSETCGMGICQRTVARCAGGMPQSCVPGTPVVEVCNGLDDDCDGTPDDGVGAALCPPAPFAASYLCTAGGTCAFTCEPGRADLNGTYGDGCECAEDGHGAACSAPTNLGTVAPGSAQTINGSILASGASDWFVVSFPNVGRGPGNGNPQIRLTGPNAAGFVLDFSTSCSTAMTCGTGTATGVGSFGFIDNQSMGTNAYSGPHSTAWPTTVIFSVRRTRTAMLCADAAYTVTISR